MKTLLLLGLLALPSALQAEIPTQASILSAQMLPGWQLSGGHYMAGLNLTLAPHWKNLLARTR